MKRPAPRLALMLAVALSIVTGCSRHPYRMADPGLKIVQIDSDRNESYLGLAVDGMGRIFVGGREALFVYEPKADGGYYARKELYRFPADTWIYNIAVRGHDLYVLTASTLYVVPDGDVQRSGLQAKKLLWGFPTISVHLGMHGMSFGPDGDLYIATGDPVWYQANFGRPDHWTYWKFHHGAKDIQTPCVGTGGVLRLSPDGNDLSVFSEGTRNDCGLTFDSLWNLYGPDNDHEQDYDSFAPGRLLYITEHSYFNWPRGWMTEKQPWRSDMLQNMTAKLGPCVPVGLCYYDESFLPAQYRNSLFMARWDTRSIPHYPLQADGDTFKTEELPFLEGTDDGLARPLSVAVGRGGRIFAVCCYMEHNESTPHYKSDLYMVTTRDDPKSAPFQAFDETGATLDMLFSELNEPSWDRRFRAHIELTRRGAEAFRAAAGRLEALDSKSMAAPDLIWLAAADPDASARQKLISLTHDSSDAIRLTAVRALARFGAGNEGDDVFTHLLNDSNAQIRHAALIGLDDHGRNPALEKVVEAGAATLDRIVQDGWIPVDTNSAATGTWRTAGLPAHWEAGSYIRQTAAMILANRASARQLASWCENPDARRRLMGVLAIGFRLTLPTNNEPPDRWIPQSSVLADAIAYFGPDCMEDRVENRPYCEAAGMFSTQGIWLAVTMNEEQQTLVSLLERRLQDANKNVARQALFFLRMMRKNRAEADLATDLGLDPRLRARRPLTQARAASSTTMPLAFQGFDWAKEAAKGDRARGRELFLTRGCNRCHAIAEGDGGSGGPSLAAAGSRFGAAYIAESVMAPNAVVLPLYRWTAFQMNDGSEIDGLVVGEDAEEVEVLTPSTARQKIRKENVKSRQVQNHSPMPEGLINTPVELRDLLAFLTSLR